MEQYFKYPRTYHLPWSEEITTDDKILRDTSIFTNKTVVVTEKMDGENTTLYPNYYHARSIDGKDHESRHWLKRLHSQIKYNIPEGWRICGENLYAKHSIYYNRLPSYFLVFGIYDQHNICLSWQETKAWCSLLELEYVPELYLGVWDESFIKTCYRSKSTCGNTQEGYVVRIADEFHFNNFDKSVAKFVRKNHVQTDKHWMQTQVIPNKLL
jgi:hypothetical protein